MTRIKMDLIKLYASPHPPSRQTRSGQVWLRRAGYTVDFVATAADAHERLEQKKYALVIADWRLPDGNGIDLADRAARLGARTIIVSGYIFNLPAGAAKRHGLLTKPISIFN